MCGIDIVAAINHHHHYRHRHRPRHRRHYRRHRRNVTIVIIEAVAGESEVRLGPGKWRRGERSA